MLFKSVPVYNCSWEERKFEIVGICDIRFEAPRIICLAVFNRIDCDEVFKFHSGSDATFVADGSKINVWVNCWNKSPCYFIEKCQPEFFPALLQGW